MRKSEKTRVTRIPSATAANDKLAILTAARSRTEVKHAEHVKATVRCITLWTARKCDARTSHPFAFVTVRRAVDTYNTRPGSAVESSAKEPCPFDLAL